MTTPTCERCGQTLTVAGGMPEDSPRARTNYYVCPEHGTDYQGDYISAIDVQHLEE